MEACIATAAAANVRLLHLGHHEAKRSDRELERVERYACELMEKTLRAAGRPVDSCRVSLAYEELELIIT